MKYITVPASFIFIVLAFFTFGCQNNLRDYYKDNVYANGSIVSKNEAYYFSIKIGFPEKPISEQDSFLIELKDGKRLLVSNISRNDILILTSSKGNDATWGGYQVETYYIDNVVFIFHGEKLVSIKASSTTRPTEANSLKIGNKEMKNFYKMPLTQKQLFEIFGVPDKLYDYSVW